MDLVVVRIDFSKFLDFIKRYVEIIPSMVLDSQSPFTKLDIKRVDLYSYN